MSGGFNVKYKDLYKLSQEYKDELDDFKDAVDECSKTVADMINNDSFTGATADSVKSYLSDVHITLLASMKALAQNMQDQVALYKAGYYGIDNKTDFILGEEAINSYKTCLDTQLSRLAEREEIVNGAIDSIADLLPFKKPSTEGIYTSHQALNTEMDTLKENVSNQESMTVEALEGSTKVLLTYVKNSVNLLKGKSYQMANYTPNSFFQNKNAYAMAYLSEAFYQQHEENEDVYDSIWKAEEEKAEAARERATQGVWKTVGGVALVVTGAVCIVATAGAATPIVVAGAAAGGGTIAFGVADAAEGGQEIYYGNTGNIDSKSFNVIRDTIFQGNQEAYQVTESIFAFTASAMVPIGTAAKAGTLTFRSGSVAVGKLAISNVAGQGASKVTMDLTDNRVLSMMAGMGASALTGYGLNAIDNKYSLSYGRTLKKGIQYDEAINKLNNVDFEKMSVSDVNKLLDEAQKVGLGKRDTLKLQTEILRKSGFSNFDSKNTLADISAFNEGTIKVEEMDGGTKLYRRGYPTEGTGKYSYGRWWAEEHLSIEDARNKLAILEEWGNPLTGDFEMTPPSNTRCITGTAAPQHADFSSEFRAGGLKQYWFNDIDPSWIK